MTLDLAEALLCCGELRREDIPPVAMELLESGTDSPTLRELAGLTAGELSRAHDLLRRVLHELGRSCPSSDRMARTIARTLASQAVERGANLRGLAASGARYAIALDYHRDLMPFYMADDEYGNPNIWSGAEVDQDLVRYAKSLLESEPAV
jgi:hypothetical protein